MEFKSWVDLSKSESPTPPHHLQHSTTEPPSGGGPPRTNSPPPSTSTNSLASDLPPAYPHTTSHSISSLVTASPPGPAMQSSPTPGPSSQGGDPCLTFGNTDEYLRLLCDARRETTSRDSLDSSRRDSPRGSPKSPPNSPNTGLVIDSGRMDQMHNVYINHYSATDDGSYVRVENKKEKKMDADTFWDWSSRPDTKPPKMFRFSRHSGNAVDGDFETLFLRRGRGSSLRKLRLGRASVWSKDIFYTLLISNMISFLLGSAGLACWIYRRSGSTLAMATMPLN